MKRKSTVKFNTRSGPVSFKGRAGGNLERQKARRASRAAKAGVKKR